MIQSISVPQAPAAIGARAEGGIAVQTEQVMKSLSAMSAGTGYGFKSMAKAICFLADIADFSAFNKVYGCYFASKPARSCITVKALPRGALV